MKKILALTLAMALTLVLASCTKDKEVSENENVQNEIVDEVVDETAGEETPEVDDDVPATMPEEDAPAVMPEVDTEADADVPATMPEEDIPAVMPEVDTEADADVPATMPGEDTPAVMPEVEPETEENEAETPVEDTVDGAVSIDTLFALTEKLYDGINPEDMPMVGTMELTEENFEYSAFVPYKSTYLAVESLPMMGSMPHSVVIVKADSEAEAAQLAKDMEANANPRKWICVSARSVKAASKGQYAILVMTSCEVMPENYDDEAAIEAAEVASNEKSEERANIIINNFLAAV